jgi:nucleotide-binding universal stress UspA family protein
MGRAIIALQMRIESTMEKLKILIPTDFSIQAEYAYLMVKKLEEKVDVEVHFLHVMVVPETVTIDLSGHISTCGEIDVNYVVHQKQIAERKLQELKSNYGDGIQTHLLFGKITDRIIDFAENQAFDLVAMGTKGAWGLKEKLSGSETQMIARKSNVPVLSLMCDRSDLVIKNILLVHDFTDPKSDDLRLMKRLIKAFDAKLHQLQIVKTHSSEQEQALTEKMSLHAQTHGISNFENHVISDVDIESGVVHFNQMNEMDVVCIGMQGKGGLFHSSATEKLINHLFKPIISFHIQ